MKQYIADAKRTEPTYDKYFEAYTHRMNPKVFRLLHGAIGLTTESGELMDALKKHIYYGKPLDTVNLAEEIGDIMWYCAIILDELGTDFESVMKTNIEKLKARFPEKFTEKDAIERNLEIEREILERG